MIEHDNYLAIHWLESNSVKLSQDKSHLLVSGFKHEIVWAQIGKAKIWGSKKQTLLGAGNDRTLSLDEYIAFLCRKAGEKSVLDRLSNFLSTNKERVLMKAFIKSQFDYYPIIWMFHSMGVNNEINYLHKRSLGVVYKYDISFSKVYLEGINCLLFIRRKFSHLL